MNKNLLRNLEPFLLCLLLPFALVCSTNASFLEVSEDLTISGNGTIDRDFTAQSTPDFSGQKLAETIVPVFSPHASFTTSSYRSNFELALSNNPTIHYEAISELPNVKHYLSNKNYELGVYTSFYYIGNQKKVFSLESSPSLSEALVKSEAEGRSVLRAGVFNASESHSRIIKSLTWLEGNYSLDWAFRVLDVDHPEAGEDDYLGCP